MDEQRAKITTPRHMINFDRPRLKRLKEAYAKAVELKQDTFTFDGHLLVVSYAKYMIEYLEGQLK